MEFDLTAMLVFVFVTTFTPGPNNLLSASMGALYGYRKTLPFLFGIMAGFLSIMVLSATISTALRSFLPSATPVLRIFGAAYILYLAFGIYRGSGALLERPADARPLPFWTGLMLQFVNPKAIFYGLTIPLNYLTSTARLFPLPTHLLKNTSLQSAQCLANLHFLVGLGEQYLQPLRDRFDVLACHGQWRKQTCRFATCVQQPSRSAGVQHFTVEPQQNQTCFHGQDACLSAWSQPDLSRLRWHAARRHPLQSPSLWACGWSHAVGHAHQFASAFWGGRISSTPPIMNICSSGIES